MEDKKISQLPISTTLDGTELVPIVQGGVTVQATSQDIADLNTPTLQDLQSVTDEGRTTTHSITANAFIKTGGTSTQFLKANGTVDNSIYITIADVPNFVNLLKQRVKADENLIKGQAVYVSGANGANILVQKGDNRNEPTSSKILGLVAENLSLNDQGYVITEGVLEGLDTGSATEGDPVWLGINGELIYGLVNKPYAPEHLVFIGIVTRAHSTVGSIFVKVQNGFELREIHDVDLITTTPSDNEVLTYELSTGLWKNKTVVSALGFTPYNSTNPSGYITGINSSMVTTALGFTPYNSTNPSGYITGITSGMVTTALGFTPYNATNPSGYITSSALSTYVPYTGATTNLNLGTFTLTTPTINGVSGLLSFGSTDRVSVGNYATPSAQRIFTVGQDTAWMTIGSCTDLTSQMGIFFGSTSFGYSNAILRGNSGAAVINCQSNTGTVQLQIGGIARFVVNGIASSGIGKPFIITPANNTGQTASTAIPGWEYLASTRQWATGNITTQSENVWGATTYSFVGASTITNAYGNVFNAPVAGTNTTITNNYSAQFNGKVEANLGLETNTLAGLNTAGANLLIVSNNTATKGTITIGNNNSEIVYLGNQQFAFTNVFLYGASNANSFLITRVTASDTAPVYVTNRGDQTTGIGGSLNTISLITASTTKVKLFNSGNLTIQNGGTFTDNGFRLDVNGTGRFQNTLTLATGTTTIAPLKLTAGTNLTTPVNGSFEFDGHELYFTKDGQRFLIMMVPA